MSHHVGNVGTQDLSAVRGMLHRQTELPGPTLESIASEIKGVLASMVRHSDKDLKVGTVRPDPSPAQGDKFTALIKHIMQELQQILSGTKEKFMNCGNQPGQGPHHPPPQGPHGHGLPPVFKELQAAAAKLDAAEAKLSSAQAAENKMETALYGKPVAAESMDTKKAKKEVAAAQAGVLKALLHMVEGLEGRGHGPTKAPKGEPAKEPTDIEQLIQGWKQTMEQFAGVGAKVKAKLHHGQPHGPNQLEQHVPPVFKELFSAVVKLEVAEHKLHAAQSKEDRIETKLYGAPVSAESTATTQAKKDVAAAQVSVVTALHHILEGFAESGIEPVDDPVDGCEGVAEDPVYVGTEPVTITAVKPKPVEHLSV